ncbi:MAG: hypothetical protein QMD50_01150 [Patescibacteria group bacterium]|nr:hypothetical protein [Patescibacteria group bacterium]
MKINTNSLLWQIAYEHCFRDKRPLNQVSVCRLFWTVVGGVFAWLFQIIAVILLLTFGNLICFFAAKRIPFDLERVTPYKHWPKIKGHRIYPISMLGFLWIIYSIWFKWGSLCYLLWKPDLEKFMESDGNALYFFTAFTDFVIATVVVVIVISAISAGICLFFEKIRESDFGTLLLEYLKAKKQKICPMIDIVEEKTKQSD